MGGKSQKTSSEPWKDIQPYLLDTAETAGDLFARGNLAPDNVGLGTVTKQGLSSLAALGRNNSVTDGAVGGLQGFMDAPDYQSGPGATPSSYGSIDPNFGIQAVRDNISDTVLPQVASMFGQGGFTNSTTAQQVAANAMTSALAPAEYDQINRNQSLNINQFNTEQDRGMTRDAQLFDQFATQQGQTLQGLSLAPSINDLQTRDAQNLIGVGQIRDQNRLASKSNASNEVQAAAQLFSQLGGLGQSGKSTPSTLQSIGGLGSAASSAALAFSLFCDRRLKTDVTRVGTWRGVALYTFRYLWDDVLRIGPMAQEVPERARIKVGDFYAVNLGAI